MGYHRLLTMATVVMKKSMNFGVRFPKETIDKLDRLKGTYNSRNQLLRKIVDEFLASIEDEVEQRQQNQKGVRSSNLFTNVNSTSLSTFPAKGGPKLK